MKAGFEQPHALYLHVQKWYQIYGAKRIEICDLVDRGKFRGSLWLVLIRIYMHTRCSVNSVKRDAV